MTQTYIDADCAAEDQRLQSLRNEPAGLEPGHASISAINQQMAAAAQHGCQEDACYADDAPGVRDWLGEFLDWINSSEFLLRAERWWDANFAPVCWGMLIGVAAFALAAMGWAFVTGGRP
jgi:hypothetical protein